MEKDIVLVWNRTIHDFEMFLKLEKGLLPNSIDAYIHDVSYLSEYSRKIALAVRRTYVKSSIVETLHKTILDCLGKK